eukprot:jgi/Chrzof1/2313/Cz11g10190.t1
MTAHQITSLNFVSSPLFLGHTAYSDSIPEWESSGVKVIQVFSNGDPGQYVQSAFATDANNITNPAGVGVVMCGHKEMVNAVKEVLTSAGVDQGKVLLNF